jgi:hypothetical protein
VSHASTDSLNIEKTNVCRDEDVVMRPTVASNASSHEGASTRAARAAPTGRLRVRAGDAVVGRAASAAATASLAENGRCHVRQPVR